jgi:hypothetical protein
MSPFLVQSLHERTSEWQLSSFIFQGDDVILHPSYSVLDRVYAYHKGIYPKLVKYCKLTKDHEHI